MLSQPRSGTSEILKWPTESIWHVPGTKMRGKDLQKYCDFCLKRELPVWLVPSHMYPAELNGGLEVYLSDAMNI